VHLDRYGEPPDTLTYLIWPRMRKVQSHVAAAIRSVVPIEAVTWNEGDILG
jgi:hypothetical protein